MFVKKYILSSATPFATPYYIFTGPFPGPVFMVVSGIHGNETGSIRAAQDLVNMLLRRALSIQKGTLIIVPLVNIKAYRKRSRGVPDLNRTFPRKSNTAARHPLAAALFQLVQRYRPAWYLDLHEANGLSQRNAKRLGQTLIIQPGSCGVSIVRHIIENINSSIPKSYYRFNLRLREFPGSSRTAAARIIGAKAVTVETCWNLEHALRVNYQKDIVCRFLRI